VYLEKINVIGAEALQRGLYLVEDCCARETGLIDIFTCILEFRLEHRSGSDLVSNKSEAFGKDYESVTRNSIL
jgi:hypothetical protein